MNSETWSEVTKSDFLSLHNTGEPYYMTLLSFFMRLYSLPDIFYLSRYMINYNRIRSYVIPIKVGINNIDHDIIRFVFIFLLPIYDL